MSALRRRLGLVVLLARCPELKICRPAAFGDAAPIAPASSMARPRFLSLDLYKYALV
jgi:hypothetical protein